MNDSQSEQLETAIGRLQSQERRAAIDRGYIRSRLDPKQKNTGGSGSVELVAFTGHAGTGGDENAPGNFTYTFRDRNNVTHTNVAPSQQRAKMTVLPATIGEWDNVAFVLVALDEVPVTSVCSSTPAIAPAPSDTPFFGF